MNMLMDRNPSPRALAAEHVLRALDVMGQLLDHTDGDRATVQGLRQVLTEHIAPQLGVCLRERDPEVAKKVDELRQQAGLLPGMVPFPGAI